MDIAQIGLAGAHDATRRFEESAQRTASGQGDLVAETVEQVSSKAAFDASLAVIRTGDEMMKRLLDIKV